MTLDPDTMRALIAAAAEQVIACAPELTALDQAIGDGDHGTNMKRGFEAVLGRLDVIAAQPPGDAVKAVGKTLVMTVGGASGPLYGSFFMALGAAIAAGGRLPEDLVQVFASRPDLMRRIRATASAAAERTAPMLATKGRAAFLGARSIGHVDPGARSSCVLLHAICNTLEARL
jgi:dihydroxyacetone kinase-like protein